MAQRRDLGNRKRWLLAVLALCLSSVSFSHDLIIFRDGTEKEAKVTMVTNDITSYTVGKSDESSPNTAIYMIKYEKRGNVFFTDDGKRFSGDGDGKVPSSATAIYLIEGDEVVAYNVTIDNGTVQFATSKKKNAQQKTLPSDAIFLIKYPDGTRDLMNDFEEIKQRKAEAEAERLRLEEEARQAEMRNRYPKDAVIKTQRNVEIKVSLLSENEKVVTYKKASLKNSPIFHMDKENIKEIEYNE